MKKLLFLTFILTCWMNKVVDAQSFTADDVVFRSGDHVLNGTLVLPDTAQHVPVLVFMGGVNDYGDFHPSRDAFIAENLESIFPEMGIGILYFDLRGTGESTGRWQRTTLEEFAADAKAAIEFLKNRREVDATRIGLIGHGEYGWAAQIAAAQHPEDFKIMISLATAPFNARRQLVNEYHSYYVCDDQDSTEAYEKAERKALSHSNWVSVFPITKRWRHMKLMQEFDPEQYLLNIDIPSLLLFAENDASIYPGWAMEQLNNIFENSSPENFTIQVVPGANHYFKIADRCYDVEENPVEKNYSFRFKEIFRDWVLEHL